MHFCLVSFPKFLAFLSAEAFVFTVSGLYKKCPHPFQAVKKEGWIPLSMTGQLELFLLVLVVFIGSVVKCMY